MVFCMFFFFQIVEKFFSKDIRYLVSSKPEARHVQRLVQDSPVPSPDSGLSSPHPGSRRDSHRGSSQGPADTVRSFIEIYGYNQHQRPSWQFFWRNWANLSLKSSSALRKKMESEHDIGRKIESCNSYSVSAKTLIYPLINRIASFINVCDFLLKAAVISPPPLCISQVFISRGKSLVEKVVKEQVSAFVYSGGSSQSWLQILWIIIVDSHQLFGNFNHITDLYWVCHPPFS